MAVRVDSDWFARWTTRDGGKVSALAPTQIKVLMRGESKEVLDTAVTTQSQVHQTSSRARAVSAPSTAAALFQPTTTLLRVEPAQPLPESPPAYVRSRHIRVSADTSGNAVRVLDFLFLGNLLAAYDDRLLCRHNIDCVIDLSGLEAREVPVTLKSLCPCPCPPGTHARPKLRVQIPPGSTGNDVIDSEQKESRYGAAISESLADINEFLESARRNGRRVLIYDDDCGAPGGGSTWRAPAVVVQYLARAHRLRVRQALGVVRKVWPVPSDRLVPSLVDMMHSADRGHRRRVSSVETGSGIRSRAREAAWLAAGDVTTPVYAWC